MLPYLSTSDEITIFGESAWNTFAFADNATDTIIDETAPENNRTPSPMNITCRYGFDRAFVHGDMHAKSKKAYFRHLESEKTCNHRTFISGYMCHGTPSFDFPTPNFAGSSNLNFFPGSGPGTESSKVPVFQDRKAITLCSGC